MESILARVHPSCIVTHLQVQPHFCRKHPWTCWCCIRLHMCMHKQRMWGVQRDTGLLWFIDTNYTVSIRHALRISGMHALVDTHTRYCTGLCVFGRCMWKCSLIVSVLSPAAWLCCKFTNWCVDSSFIWVLFPLISFQTVYTKYLLTQMQKKMFRCFKLTHFQRNLNKWKNGVLSFSWLWIFMRRAGCLCCEAPEQLLK